MKVLILGGGVIGTTIAYYTALRGHEVTVLDRQPAVGLETSFANAGEISPGYSTPWAAPNLPLKVLKWLFMKHSPLIIKPSLDPKMWQWMLDMLQNCNTQAYKTNKSRMLRLAEYSRDCLRDLRISTKISYDERSLGTLQLLRTEKQLNALNKDIAILDEFNVPYQLLTPDEILAYEPALASTINKFKGGLRLPGDETGDCHQFTKKLAAIAKALGATFKCDEEVIAINRNSDSITEILTTTDIYTADQYVVALGSYSSVLLRQIDIHIPVYPLKGFSLTIPIADSQHAPMSTLMDETYKVAITRLGDRIRIGGMAQLSGYDLKLYQRPRETLEFVFSDIFPKAGDISQATFWTGLRPMTPDSTPIIGKTKYSNLLLSTGHGTLGWTMAAGTGKVVADIISNCPPEIETNDLAMTRYQ